ncbi:hypothetical protein BS78_04G169100 [Paspalum vaginatum]|nr:hypothetical protein BS78_04G169100 [Paspalum vaginatum]
MAPRAGRASPRAGALTAGTALLLLLLLLSSLPLSTNAAAAPAPGPGPAPAPAPAPPARHSPPVLPPGPGNKKKPRGATRPVPLPPQHAGPRHGRPPPAAWWHRLNFGERLGVALAGVAVLMQVAVAAFVAVRSRQLRRAPPGAGKAAEERLEAASPPPAA